MHDDEVILPLNSRKAMTVKSESETHINNMNQVELYRIHVWNIRARNNVVRARDKRFCQETDEHIVGKNGLSSIVFDGQWRVEHLLLMGVYCKRTHANEK